MSYLVGSFLVIVLIKNIYKFDNFSFHLSKILISLQISRRPCHEKTRNRKTFLSGRVKYTPRGRCILITGIWRDFASRIVSVNASRSKSSATSIYWLSYYAGSSIIGSLTGIILTRFGWDTFVEILLMLTTLSYLISSLATGSFHISLVFHNSSEKSLSPYD